MTIFESNGYHVERTIESIIGMEQPELVEITPQQPPKRERHVVQRDIFEDHSYEEQPPTQPTVHSAPAVKHRGARVQLPDDFLRIPKQKTDALYLQDEQLALMLQNELFREQVDQLLGNPFARTDPFADDLDGLRHTSNRNRQAGTRVSNSQVNAQRGAPAASSTDNTSSGDILGIPDMGILTTLRGMGEGMRKQLNQLAVNFNTTKGNGNGGNGNNRQDEESRPLTSREYSYEEEEEEEGDFYNRGGKKDK